MRSNFIVLAPLSISTTNDTEEGLWGKKKNYYYYYNFNETKLMNTNNNYVSSLSRWGGNGSSLGGVMIIS
jgi:hypothetical protein